jgi:drug/metabolite transporter (DMT)-like permease
MMDKRQPDDAAASAKLLVLLMGVAWGVNWIATRIILEALQPWAMRAIGMGLGTLTLFAAASISRVPLTIARRDWLKVAIAGFFNVALLCMCSAYALVLGTTSRAIVITYSTPIWAALLARFVLKERLTAVTLAALGLCVAGLAILIEPLARTGFPLGALLALASAWSWAAGTVYLKWTKIAAPTLAVAAWQVLFGWLMLTAGMLAFEGLPTLWPQPPHIVAWIAYNGLIGMGLAYFLWFIVVDRLPATTAALGSLLAPVVGIVGATLLLGERPNLSDAIGFAMIFAAAASVLLQPNVKHTEMPE